MLKYQSRQIWSRTVNEAHRGLKVRPFHADDIPALLHWFPTPEALGQWGSPERSFPLDTKQVEAFLSQTVGGDPKAVMWAGEDQGAMVATATTFMNWHQGVALLGLVAVSPTMRGRGIAKPFLKEIIALTFSDTRVERMELNVYTFNHSAIRTYETLGFVKEGVRRSLARMGADRWDAGHYSLLRSEATLG